jgi:hypothetical protein
MESANALGVFGVEKAKFHPPSGILPRSQTGGHWVQISVGGRRTFFDQPSFRHEAIKRGLLDLDGKSTIDIHVLKIYYINL